MGMMSQSEVAAALGVSVKTVTRLRADKRLRWLKVRGQVRITRDDLSRYLRSAAPDAGAE